MLETIFHAHSGLRFLVLLGTVVALLVHALGVFGRQPYGRPSRISMAVFGRLLDLQILLGIVMVVLGCFYGALMGHLLMMVLAAVAAHACGGYAKKQADARRAHTVGLVGVVWSWARLRASYAVWMTLNWLLWTSTSFILSVPRYTLVMFPLYILLARAAARWPVAGGLVVVWSLLFMGLFIGRFVTGNWAF